jgi:NAD(P)-dependent dehydrogenase (short-subunit alcohol dehydrogenase family)
VIAERAAINELVDLTGKRAFVTGGGQGIGTAISRRLVNISAYSASKAAVVALTRAFATRFLSPGSPTTSLGRRCFSSRISATS